MPEVEMPAANTQGSDALRSAAPWLEFGVHHPKFGLAAEASLRGSLAVLVGPSGSGKTSLLRSIAGLVRPARGAIRVMGVTTCDSARSIWLPPAARGCGLVMQQPALFPALTVAENIAFGLHRLAREERNRRVGEMAALFRLEPLVERRPAELSGGEQQRVSVARTLAPRPGVLLLDEPFAGLNMSLKDAILTDLERWLAASGTPAVYVTHDVADAWRTGCRPGAEVLRMEAGRIVQQGTAAAVLAEERARLLASLN